VRTTEFTYNDVNQLVSEGQVFSRSTKTRPFAYDAVAGFDLTNGGVQRRDIFRAPVSQRMFGASELKQLVQARIASASRELLPWELMKSVSFCSFVGTVVLVTRDV